MVLQTENLKVKYLIIGLILGVFTSIILNLISISINNYSFSIGAIIQMNKENPVNLLLIVSPIIILALIGYLTGISVEKIITRNNYKIKQNKSRFEYIYNFIESIRKEEDKTDAEEVLEKDKIGISLINLRSEIKKNKEENKTKQEEEIQRHWISEGLALFGAVLREYNESIEILANKIISELVKYTDVKQAGFFIISENGSKEKIITEIANFAYGKKRIANKKILWGEGLIGACIIEKKTSLLKNIGAEYTEIESGLGAAKPKSVLIVPLMTDEGVVHGALELASFTIFKDFEIKFAEQIAESIATTISSIKINEETAKLLEESKEYTSTMTKQEEELRKTISDMERLQANADVQSSAFRAYQDSTNKSLINVEYSTDGKLIFANKKFLKLFGYKSNSEIQNENISKFLHSDYSNWFDDNKKNIIITNKHFEGVLAYTTKNGTTVWINSSYIGLKNDRGLVEKILFLGSDVTSLKALSENLYKKVNTLENNILKIELSLSGEILKINDKFLSFLDFKKDDIINKNIDNFTYEDDINNITTIIKNVTSTGQTFEGKFVLKTSNNSKAWFKGVVFQEFDINNNVLTINIIAFEHTEEHLTHEQIRKLESELENKSSEIITLKDRIVKRVEQAKDEMKNLYVETETNNIFFEQTLASSPEIVISINNDNKIVFINNKAKELLSIDSAYLNKDVSEIFPEVPEKSKEKYLGNILNYNNENLPINKEENIFIIGKDGSKKTFKMTMTEVSIGLRKRLTVFLS